MKVVSEREEEIDEIKYKKVDKGNNREWYEMEGREAGEEKEKEPKK
jgi:hypothetical protein